jgi:hypothetical protein
MTQAPVTLGQKLGPKPIATTTAPKETAKRPSKYRGRFMEMLYSGLAMALLAITAAIPFWWFLIWMPISGVAIFLIALVPFGLWVMVTRASHATRDFGGPNFESISQRGIQKFSKPHSLLANDRQGFMRGLRLDAKTAIFDGSNVYHFGNDHGLDAQPLGMLAHRLREEGYRIVCFFDANIYHRLHEHGAFAKGTRHSVEILTDVFGLAANEIYVVPSGIQADRYILNALKHLPISFAVTNDKFRDYAKQYPDVMKGQWRKGVVISNQELRLTQHKLQTPIKIG